MKFRGDYTVVGKMTSKEVVTPKITIDNMTVNKAFTLASSVTTDMGSNPLKKLGAPVDAADAATKQFVEDTSIAVTVREEIPDFTTDVIPSKPNDLLLVGHAPGPIQCSDARVTNKNIFDIDCSLTNTVVYALVQDSTNALISSTDGGKTWSYVKKMLADFGDPGSTNDANKFKYITATSDNRLVAFRGKMEMFGLPASSIDRGKTWSPISVQNLDRMASIEWLPARLSKPSSGPIFLTNTTADISQFLVLTYNSTLNQLSPETIDAAAKPSGRVVSAASYGDILVIITSAGETVVRTAQNNYIRGGNLPQTGVVWNDVVAIDANTWVACSGTGLSKSYVAISTNQGASWTQKEVSASNISLTGIHYNVKAGAQGTLIVTGQNATYISTDKGTTWVRTENYKIPASQNVTPVGTGFIAASTTGNFEILYSGKTWVSDIEGEYSDMFYKTPSGWAKYTPGFNGEDYLPLSGGTVTGQIKLASSGSITGVCAPTLPDDAAPKSYVDGEVTKAIATTKTEGDKAYLKLTGGRMTGDVSMEGIAKLRFVKTTNNVTKNLQSLLYTQIEGLNSFEFNFNQQEFPSYIPNSPGSSTNPVKSIGYGGNVGIAVGKSFVTRSTDTGYVWSKLAGNADLISAKFEPNKVSYANSTWFIGCLGGIFYSKDAGATWAKATVPDPADNYFAVAYYGGSFYCGMSKGVAKSTDGITWVFEAVGPASPFVQYMGVAARYERLIIAGTNGTCYTYDSTSRVWARQTIPGATDIRTVAAINTNPSFALASDRKIYKSADGLTWEEVTTAPTSDDGQSQGLVYNGANLIAGYGTGGKFYVSKNNGTAWTTDAVTNNGYITNGYITDLAIIDNDVFLAASSTGAIHRTNQTKSAISPIRINADGIFLFGAQSARPDALTRRDYVDRELAKKLNKAGDTLLGTLVLAPVEGSILAPYGSSIAFRDQSNTTYHLITDGTTLKVRYRGSFVKDCATFSTDGSVAASFFKHTDPQSSSAASSTRKDYVDGEISKVRDSKFSEYSTQLDTKNINTLGALTDSGIYYQIKGSQSSSANGYPVTEEGVLVVTKSLNGGCQQEYTTARTGRKFFRSLNGTWNGTGPWSGWLEYWGENSQISSDKLTDKNTIFKHRNMLNTDGVQDLNLSILPGHYQVNGDAVNHPNSGVNGHMTVSASGYALAPDVSLQQTFYAHNNKVWTRCNVNNSWGPWQRIYNTLDTPTAAETGALALAGGTMWGNLTLQKVSPNIVFRDTGDERGAILLNTSNAFYILRTAAPHPVTKWDAGPNDRPPMILNLLNGDVAFSGNVTEYSDARLKKDVVPLTNCLDKINALNGVNYKRIGEDTDRLECGFIAQEVQKVIPEVIIEQADEEKTLTMDYARLTSYLVEAVKELTSKVKDLEAHIKTLESK